MPLKYRAMSYEVYSTKKFLFFALSINMCCHYRLLCTLFCGRDKPLRLHQEPSKLQEIILVEFICNTSPEILTCLINYIFEKDRRNFSKDNRTNPRYTLMANYNFTFSL